MTAIGRISVPRRFRRDPSDPIRRLWDQCVFLDWHGVLCEDVFWQSISGNARHQRQRHLSAAVEQLFGDTELTARWMRGQIDARAAVARLGAWEDRRCRDDYLYRRLYMDCQKMRPQQRLLDLVASLPPLTLVVVATDNMDCFSDSLPFIDALHDRVHGVVCSSDVGVLKAEDPPAFFGAFLEEQGLTSQQALLVDDSKRNCTRFVEFGGTAIHYTDSDAAVGLIARWAHETAQRGASSRHARCHSQGMRRSRSVLSGFVSA
ncbi:MAG TPA: hypothetical protein VLK58_02785 [Conexibacter sp.]|nr:hypothetical protein [Conexibacter sp.]